MADSANIQNEVKKYYKVFLTLMLLTVITVGISNLKVGIAMAVFLALLVATTKASLVASVFMHLSHERKLIYVVLLFTVFFFASMIGLIIAGDKDVPEGWVNLNKQEKYAVSHGSYHGDSHGGGELSESGEEEPHSGH